MINMTKERREGNMEEMEEMMGKKKNVKINKK
jgi:hypothetical protein